MGGREVFLAWGNKRGIVGDTLRVKGGNGRTQPEIPELTLQDKDKKEETGGSILQEGRNLAKRM